VVDAAEPDDATDADPTGAGNAVESEASESSNGAGVPPDATPTDHTAQRS